MEKEETVLFTAGIDRDLLGKYFDKMCLVGDFLKNDVVIDTLVRNDPLLYTERAYIMDVSRMNNLRVIFTNNTLRSQTVPYTAESYKNAPKKLLEQAFTYIKKASEEIMSDIHVFLIPEYWDTKEPEKWDGDCMIYGAIVGYDFSKAPKPDAVSCAETRQYRQIRECVRQILRTGDYSKIGKELLYYLFSVSELAYLKILNNVELSETERRYLRRELSSHAH